MLSLLPAIVDAASVASHDRAEIRLGKLVEEMREHPESEYPLDRIAESLGLSPSNLLVRFKHLTGLPPHAFLLKQRILRAKRMLMSQMPVSAIAHQLGFSSSQHFSNQFKSATGMSPTAYAERKSEISNAIP